MNYAIKTLEAERDLLNKALSNWESEQYPEAKKQRDKRLQQLDQAVKLIMDEV